MPVYKADVLPLIPTPTKARFMSYSIYSLVRSVGNGCHTSGTKTRWTTRVKRRDYWQMNKSSSLFRHLGIQLVSDSSEYPAGQKIGGALLKFSNTEEGDG
jgi:hypothetical protein